tara:strand:+ start:20614 stop:21057 length:444 start_codon:yes stop_codon:yes gene_type:complete
MLLTLCKLYCYFGSDLKNAGSPSKNKAILYHSTSTAIELWDMLELKCLRQIGNTSELSMQAKLCPNKDVIVTFHSDFTDCILQFWDVATFVPMMHIKVDYSMELFDMHLDGTHMFVWSRKEVQVFELPFECQVIDDEAATSCKGRLN